MKLAICFSCVVAMYTAETWMAAPYTLVTRSAQPEPQNTRFGFGGGRGGSSSSNNRNPDTRFFTGNGAVDAGLAGAAAGVAGASNSVADLTAKHDDHHKNLALANSVTSRIGNIKKSKRYPNRESNTRSSCAGFITLVQKFVKTLSESISSPLLQTISADILGHADTTCTDEEKSALLTLEASVNASIAELNTAWQSVQADIEGISGYKYYNAGTPKGTRFSDATYALADISNIKIYSDTVGICGLQESFEATSAPVRGRDCGSPQASNPPYLPTNGRVGEIVDMLQFGRNPLVGNNLGGFPFSSTTIDPKKCFLAYMMGTYTSYAGNIYISSLTFAYWCDSRKELDAVISASGVTTSNKAARLRGRPFQGQLYSKF